MNTRKFFLFITALILFYVWYFRGYYIPQFDSQYINDFYDHSQWTVPQSVRVMGDDGRYEVAGYRLFHGGKLYEVAPEVPSLGKYLLGASIALTGRSLSVVLLFFILGIFGFYLLSGFFFKTQQTRFIATLLFLLTPNVALALSRPTLDFIQLTFLIYHFYFLFSSIHQSTKRMCLFLFLSGVMSGCFVSVKFGLFIFPVLLADLFLLWKFQRLRHIIFILLLTPLVYFLSTVGYFFEGGTAYGWLASQKWILQFYRDSNTGFIPGMALLTIISSFYRGWWNAGWEMSVEWSILLVTGFCAFLYCFYTHFRKSDDDYWHCAGIYVFSTIGVLSVIAFWPRYLLLITPFFVLFTVRLFLSFRFSRHLFFIFTFVLCLQLIHVLLPQPTRTIASFKENYEKQLFQKIYMSSVPIKGVSREQFWRHMLSVHERLGVYSLRVSVGNQFVFPWENELTVPLDIRYMTNIGVVEHRCSQQFIRTSGIWKSVWNWKCILPGYSYTSEIKKEIFVARQGIVRSPQGSVISEGAARLFVYVIPGKVTDEIDLVRDIGILTGLERYFVIKKFRENTPPDYYAPIGFVLQNHDHVLLEKVRTYSGVFISSVLDRSTALGDKKASEDFLRYMHAHYEKVFGYNGGSIILIKEGRPTKIYSNSERNGQDVMISEYKGRF